MVQSQNFAPAFSSQGVPSPQFNGRIDLMSPLPVMDLPQYQRPVVDNSSYAAEAIVGQIDRNNLSDIFFSTTNINALQEGLRYRVYVETNGVHTIGRQSDMELKIVMRSIYLQYARHDNTPIIEQVRRLNQRVLDWIVPEVVSNVKQYVVYKKDSSTLPVPLDRAQYLSNKGTKMQELKSFM